MVSNTASPLLGILVVRGSSTWFAHTPWHYSVHMHLALRGYKLLTRLRAKWEGEQSVKPLHQRAFSLTSVWVLHLRLKLHFTDTNDRGGCYHISSSDICTQTHNTCKGSFATSCGCVHVFTSCSIVLYLPVVMRLLLSLPFCCLPLTSPLVT